MALAYEIGAVRASASFDASGFHSGVQSTRSSLRSLRGSFDETSRDALRSMSAMERGWDTNVSKTKASVKDHTLAVMGLVQANSRGSVSARAWAADLDRNARSFDNLRASLDPVYAQSKQYEAVVEKVKTAVSSGVASQAYANRVMDLAATKYLGLTSAAERMAEAKKKEAAITAAAAQSYHRLRSSIDPVYARKKQLEAAVETLTAAQKAGVISDRERVETLQLLRQNLAAVGPASSGAQKGVNKFGYIANQVGFQIQDVFVSGPMIGWFRAVAQQAPQAAGAFSMLGGSIGTIVPWLGTALAIGAALAPTLLNMGDASEKMSEQARLNASAVDAVVGALDDYSRYSEIARRSTVDLIEEFGVFAEDVRRTYEYLSGVSVKRAMDALKTDNFDLFANLSDAASVITQMDDALSALERNKALGATSEQVQIFQENFEALEDEAYIAAQAIGLLPEQVMAIKSGFDELKNAQGLEDIRRQAQNALDVIQKIYPEGAKIPSAFTAAAIHLKGVIHSASAAVAETQKASGETFNWAAALSGVNAEVSTIKRLLSAIGGGILSNAAKQTAIDALRAGQSIKSAAVEAERFRKELEFDARRENAQTWLDKMVVDAEAAQYAHGLALDATLDKERTVARERDRNLKKVSSASAKSTNQLKKEAAAVRSSLSPIARYNDELAELAKLKGLLSDDEMAKAVANMNVELADSLPLVGDLTDTLTEGLFNGFKGTLDSMGDIFKRWLIQLISTAAKNRIMLSLGFGGSLAGTTASALGGLGGGGASGGGGGNPAGSLVGLSGLGSSLVSGFGLGASTLFGGGLSAYTGLLGAQGAAALTGSLTSIAGFAGALGPIAIGIAVLAKGLSREYDGRAVRGSLGPDGFDGFEFDFWDGGFLRGDKQVNYDTRPEIQKLLDDGADAVRTNVEKMAEAMGLGADAIKEFTAEGFTIWLTGQNAGSQEQIAKAFEEQLTKLGDGMADLVLKTEDYAKEGEGAYETLTRLGGSLITANEGFGLLNQSLFEGSLKAAESASALMDAFGGVEQFTTGLGSYFELMFTDVERQAKRQEYAQKALDEAAGELNLTLPTTHAEFRNLVGGLDRTTEEGRTAYVTLIGLADEFAVVHGNAQEAADALEGAGDSLSQLEAEAQKLKEQNIRSALSDLNAAIKAATDDLQSQLGIVEDRLRLRFKRLQVSVGVEREAITSAHEQLIGTLSGRLETLEAAAEASRALFETLDEAAQSRRRVDAEGAEWERRRALMYVQGGGSDPAKLSKALGVLGEDNSASFSNYADYLSDYYRTSNIISGRAGEARSEMSADEAAVDALQQQIDLATLHHQEEMQRLDQILEDARQTLDMALGQYVAAIRVENAVAQLTHTADRHALVSERVEVRMAELETIRLSMEQLVEGALGAENGLPSINQGVQNVVGAVNALGGSIGQMTAGIAAATRVQAEANRIAQTKALERKHIVTEPRSASVGSARDDGTVSELRELRKEVVRLREGNEGYLGPISKATGATERTLKRAERDRQTTKGAA
ncbi:hypothetical protein PhaeoP10_02258 [Phaeobacter inhibens]|nr:hypothetical protein PGA1_c22330 [Phaeobacter inhibens DSM 17395]AUQ46588.1 hypothetical protein PhaeoP10_02258 [Phaeobacter inhibens]